MRPWLCLFALCGCAVVRPAVHAPVAADPRPARVTLLRDAPLATVPGPSCRDGTSGQAHGRRVTVAGELRDASDDVHAARIVAGVEVRDGWVFVDAAGTVLAAPTFTAPSRVVGRVAGVTYVNPWSAGRVAIAARDGLWISDGATLFAADVPHAEGAAFRDASFGAAVLDDGGVLVTRDGGASWAPRDLDGALAYEVVFDGEALVAITTAGALALTEDGQHPVEARPPACAERFDEALVALTAVASGGASAVPLLDGGAVATAGGEVWRVGPGGDVVARTRLGAACALAPWGDAVAVRCGALYRTTDGAAFELLQTPAPVPGAPAEPHVVFSDDGVHAAYEGRCDEAVPGDVAALWQREAPRSLCVFDPAGRWLPVSLPDTVDDRWALTLVHGDAAELAWDEGGTVRAVAVPFDGPTRSIAPPDGARWFAPPGWTAHGVRVGLVRVNGRARVAFRRDGRWTLRAAPPASRAVAFEDERRGVAVGDSADAVWRTTDGAAHWVRVPLASSADASVPIAPVARCARGRCAVGDVAVIDGWGPLASGAGALVGSPPHAEEAPVVPAMPWRFWLACTDPVAPKHDPVARYLWGDVAFRAAPPATGGGWYRWRLAGGPWMRSAWVPSDGDALAGSAGLLVLDGEAGSVVARWATARDVRDVALDPELVEALHAEDLALVPDGRGGLAGLVRVDRDDPRVAVFAVDRDGAVTATRQVLLRDPDLPVALARVDGGFGVARVLAGGGLRFHALAGHDGDVDLPHAPALSVCEGAAPEADRLWANVRDVAEGPEVANAAGRVEFELRGGAACVRAVEVRSLRDADDDRGARLDVIVARATRGALVGDRDLDGFTGATRCEVEP